MSKNTQLMQKLRIFINGDGRGSAEAEARYSAGKCKVFRSTAPRPKFVYHDSGSSPRCVTAQR
eukprot:6411679-Heterocapsa_arctica.AAC.2